MPSPTSPDHHGGLAVDLAGLVGRRRALTLLAGAGLATLVGCSSSDSTAASTTAAASAGSTDASTTAAVAGACDVLPEETAGPFPGDGSNGANVLTESGVVRRDITKSIGSASGVAVGVPLSLRFTVLSAADGCTPVEGAAVYAWHCDREGRYSMYDTEIADENYLRGVQAADADGVVEFTSIFPAAYDGRWPHVHLEVYPSVAEATKAGTITRTTQLAFPKDTCDAVFATSGYEASVGNLARTSLDTDMVFSDGYGSQLATMSGSVGEGLVSNLRLVI